MKVTFYDSDAFNEFTAWAEDDKKIFRKISTLIKDIQRSPFEGIGKPEPLKYELSGYWSRRITDEHRLVYEVAEDREAVTIISCRWHYGK